MNVGRAGFATFERGQSLSPAVAASEYAPDNVPYAFVDRGFGLVSYGNQSNFTITATGALDRTKEVSALLRGTIECSGRPVKLDFNGYVDPGTGNILMTFLWDGEPWKTITNGCGGINDNNAAWSPITMWAIIEDVTPGEHVFSIAATVDGGTGYIYADSNNHLQISAMEI